MGQYGIRVIIKQKNRNPNFRIFARFLQKNDLLIYIVNFCFSYQYCLSWFKVESEKGEKKAEEEEMNCDLLKFKFLL